jgi:ssDNA-binding Zn-finger/Zn-ribbon topoisomerase 1
MATLPSEISNLKSSPALKPCPFCGGEAEYDEPMPGEFLVGCHAKNDCAVYTVAGPCKTLAEAAEAWNKRAP